MTHPKKMVCPECGGSNIVAEGTVEASADCSVKLYLDEYDEINYNHSDMDVENYDYNPDTFDVDHEVCQDCHQEITPEVVEDRPPEQTPEEAGQMSLFKKEDESGAGN